MDRHVDAINILALFLKRKVAGQMSRQSMPRSFCALPQLSIHLHLHLQPYTILYLSFKSLFNQASKHALLSLGLRKLWAHILFIEAINLRAILTPPFLVTSWLQLANPRIHTPAPFWLFLLPDLFLFSLKPTTRDLDNRRLVPSLLTYDWTPPIPRSTYDPGHGYIYRGLRYPWN